MPTARIDAKRVVVTGATSGIGRVTAAELARARGRVTIVCRDGTKGAREAEAIAADTGTDVDVAVADLSELEQVRRLGAELHDRYRRIDVLVNNAGVHARSPTVTADGFDAMLATNYLGPFLLTNLLGDLLAAAEGSRVVVVASEAHRRAGPLDPESFEVLGDYGPARSFRVYGRTKLLDLLFTFELARRWGPHGVTANAVCPGMVASGLEREMPMLGRLARLGARTPLVRTPDQGAEMSVRVATDPELAGTTGRFFTSTPGARLLPATAPCRDEGLQRRVWERTETLVGLAGG